MKLDLSYSSVKQSDILSRDYQKKIREINQTLPRPGDQG